MMLKEIIFWSTMLIVLLMILVVVNRLYILDCPLFGEAWHEVRYWHVLFYLISSAGMFIIICLFLYSCWLLLK